MEKCIDYCIEEKLGEKVNRLEAAIIRNKMEKTRKIEESANQR